MRNQNDALLELLIKAGANVNVADQYGQTALMMAASKNNRTLVRLLLASGADLTVMDKNHHPAVDFMPATRDPELPQLLKIV